MVKTIAEIMQDLHSILGDNTSDEALAFTEDLNDTINANNDGTDWKSKYEENDANWRKRYRDRFFNPTQNEPDGGNQEPPADEKKLTFESLFKED